MCGIAGAIGTQDQALIRRMTDVLRHRGPDGRGYYQRDSAHLGAAQLSIMDPASGPQPLSNATGQICIVFNGAIYNHHELRTDLQRKGHVFTTATDTEVVLRLYEEIGDDCVRHLRGMFALAILDGERLFLFEKKRELLMFELFYEIFMVHRGDGRAVGHILEFMRSRLV